MAESKLQTPPSSRQDAPGGAEGAEPVATPRDDARTPHSASSGDPGVHPLGDLVEPPTALSTTYDVAATVLEQLEDRDENDRWLWRPKALESRPRRCRGDADNCGLLEAVRAGERLADDDAEQLRVWVEWRARIARDREQNAGRLWCLLGTMEKLRAEGPDGRDWYVRLAKHLWRHWRLGVDDVDQATRQGCARTAAELWARKRPWEAA